MAEFIIAHPALKPVEIVGLLFTVAMSTTVIDTTRAGKIDMIGLFVTPSVALAILVTRRRGRAPEYIRG